MTLEELNEACRLLAANSAVNDMCFSMLMLEHLVRHEGHSVEVVCPNPDFNNLPNRKISVIAEWTNWEPREFFGVTLRECLENAVKASPDPIAGL